jgi:hypothetical protein
MKRRAVLLIRCSTEEAKTVRAKAREKRRTISGYALGILDRSLQLEEALFKRMKRLRSFSRVAIGFHLRGGGSRTALLICCSTSEAQHIRVAAGRRDTTISGFVLHALRLTWAARAGMTTGVNRVQPEY